MQWHTFAFSRRIYWLMCYSRLKGSEWECVHINWKALSGTQHWEQKHHHIPWAFVEIILFLVFLFILSARCVYCHSVVALPHCRTDSWSPLPLPGLFSFVLPGIRTVQNENQWVQCCKWKHLEHDRKPSSRGWAMVEGLGIIMVTTEHWLRFAWKWSPFTLKWSPFTLKWSPFTLKWSPFPPKVASFTLKWSSPTLQWLPSTK